MTLGPEFLGFVFEKSEESNIVTVYAAVGEKTEFMGMLDVDGDDFEARVLEMAEAKGWVE